MLFSSDSISQSSNVQGNVFFLLCSGVPLKELCLQQVEASPSNGDAAFSLSNSVRDDVPSASSSSIQEAYQEIYHGTGMIAVIIVGGHFVLM
jgi:hypothetical protein